MLCHSSNEQLRIFFFVWRVISFFAPFWRVEANSFAYFGKIEFNELQIFVLFPFLVFPYAFEFYFSWKLGTGKLNKWVNVARDGFPGNSCSEFYFKRAFRKTHLKMHFVDWFFCIWVIGKTYFFSTSNKSSKSHLKDVFPLKERFFLVIWKLFPCKFPRFE